MWVLFVKGCMSRCPELVALQAAHHHWWKDLAISFLAQLHHDLPTKKRPATQLPSHLPTAAHSRPQPQLRTCRGANALMASAASWPLPGPLWRPCKIGLGKTPKSNLARHETSWWLFGKLIKLFEDIWHMKTECNFFNGQGYGIPGYQDDCLTKLPAKWWVSEVSQHHFAVAPWSSHGPLTPRARDLHWFATSIPIWTARNWVLNLKTLGLSWPRSNLPDQIQTDSLTSLLLLTCRTLSRDNEEPTVSPNLLCTSSAGLIAFSKFRPRGIFFAGFTKRSRWTRRDVWTGNHAACHLQWVYRSAAETGLERWRIIRR